MFCSLNPLGLIIALFNKTAISSVVSDFSTNTLHLDNKAELISNEGFSVVAQIKIILTCST